MILIIDYCETEHVPVEQSSTYWRNIMLFGPETADFYTYERTLDTDGDDTG